MIAGGIVHSFVVSQDSDNDDKVANEDENEEANEDVELPPQLEKVFDDMPDEEDDDDDDDDEFIDDDDDADDELDAVDVERRNLETRLFFLYHC